MIRAVKFTGKERDWETGLDAFLARYYSGAQGRFTSPDLPLIDQDPSEPQSWNLYGYVRNNPLNAIDPSGQDCVYINDNSVDLERGNCSQKNGTYINGTIDAKSFTYDPRKGTLGYSYTNDGALGTGVIAGVYPSRSEVSSDDFFNAQGRFTSPDPENRGAKVPDPQSWNMYAYARNNPLRYTDPNGETYRVCQTGFEGQDENCGDISDEQFASFRKTQSLRFVGGNKGAIYSGNNLLGSFKQTDVDLPMDVSLALHAAGVTADREFKNAVRDVAIGVATGVVAGAVVGGIAKGLEAAPELLPFEDTDLIRRVGQALERIGKGVKQFRNDGVVFRNDEGLLPSKGPGYYSEYTVQPPTGAGRGVERLVVGQGGEVYYTPNHYGSFVRIQ